MKYIVLRDGHGEETIHTWSRSDALTHEDMADAIRGIGQQLSSYKPLKEAQVVGAGFIGDSGECYGFSYSLEIGSRGAVDTDLLRAD